MNSFRFHLTFITILLMAAGLFLSGCSQGQSADGAAENYVSQRNQCPNGDKPDKTVELTERAWKFYPSEFTVQQGDLVKVKMKVTDNGIGAGHGFAIEGFEEKVFLNGVTKNNSKTTCFEADKPAGEYTFYCATQCSTDKRHTNMAGTLVIEP